MMSDREDCGEKFNVWQQEWHSAFLKEMMEILDSRVSAIKSHSRKERFYGTSQKTVPPTNAPE